jgi:hypothetical protein
MAIDIVGEVSSEEQWHAERLYKRPRLPFLILGVILLVFMFLGMFIAPPEPASFPKRLAMSSLLCLFLLLRSGAIAPLSHFLSKKGGTRKIAVSFSNEGLLAKDGNYVRRLPWSQFKRWRSNRHVLVLMNRDSTYEAIPWRLLGQVESQHLEQLLRAHLRRAA